MGKFRKKPVVVEARLFDGSENCAAALINWMGMTPAYFSQQKDLLCISTLEGEITASSGDWIICGIKGEFYPCKPDIFLMTYEKVEE
jgi:hypothetical protein